MHNPFPVGLTVKKVLVGSVLGCKISVVRVKRLFLDSISATQFLTPAIYSKVRFMLKNAMKKERVQSRCITSVSLVFPFLMDSTTLMLLHWKSILCLATSWTHTTNLIIIFFNSLAVILVSFQLSGYCHGSHWLPQAALQPHDRLDAKVCRYALYCKAHQSSAMPQHRVRHKSLFSLV